MYKTDSNYCTLNLYKSNEAKKKKVGCFLNGKLVKTYDSLSGVSADGFTFTLVGKVCRNERKHHKGYEWKYI